MEKLFSNIQQQIADSKKALINEGYTLINGRHNLWQKNNIEYAIIYYGKIVYLNYCPLSMRILILVSAYGDLFSYNPENGRLTKIQYHKNKNGYRIVNLPTGTYKSSGRQKQLRRTLSLVVLLSWTQTQKKPTVWELKIIKGIGDEVRMYNTVVIAEFQNHSHINDEDYYLSNLEWNFVKRGQRHHAWKIGNKAVQDARYLYMNGMFPSISSFKSKWNLDVADCTISQMKYGNTWQVRTEPITPMTNPMEELKDNIG
jgi:hypothetical protein